METLENKGLSILDSTCDLQKHFLKRLKNNNQDSVLQIENDLLLGLSSKFDKIHEQKLEAIEVLEQLKIQKNRCRRPSYPLINETKEEKLEKMMKTFNELKLSVEFHAKLTNVMRWKIDGLNKELDQTSNVMEELADDYNDVKRDQLEEKLHGMRNNLIVFNLRETHAEDSEDVIRKFFYEELCYQYAYDIEFTEVFRFGKIGGHRPRPILVKFLHFRDRERVKKMAPNLRNTTYAVSEQFPKEIQEYRKLLYPVMKEAKRQRRRCVLTVDCLYIDGELYTGAGPAPLGLNNHWNYTGSRPYQRNKYTYDDDSNSDFDDEYDYSYV